MGAGFPGGTYRQIFYVADVEASGPAVNGELHVDLDEADFLAVFPLKGEGRARLIGTVRDERADHAERLKFDDVSARAIENLKVDVKTVNWFSTYHVHHRVTDHFRKGRAFLLGDAAHIHSPAGGQGMNTGIGDAINLAWKLAAVLDGRAGDALLDSYEAERIPFARRLVADHRPRLLAGDGRRPGRQFPAHPHCAAGSAGGGPLCRRARTDVPQRVPDQINYRGGPLSAGAAGARAWRRPSALGEIARRRQLRLLVGDALAVARLRQADARTSKPGAAIATCRCRSLTGAKTHAAAGLKPDVRLPLAP